MIEVMITITYLYNELIKAMGTQRIIIIIIIIMSIYHALINALSTHMIHINLNMIFMDAC